MENKVLIIGIDSMDPRIFELLKEKLPNFNKLEFTRLETTIPPETPVAWSAASTGSNPGRYGIFDFLNRDPETYRPHLNLATEKKGILKSEYTCAMKGDPVWRILSQNNMKSTIMRWPVTFPAEKVSGKMLSGLGVVDIKGLLNSYAFYTDEEREGKTIKITKENNAIETHISGPMIRKKGELIEVKIPMSIAIKDDRITLTINEKEHSIKNNEWSDMVRTKFKVYVFAEVHGICRFYLESIEPFRLYMTSIQIDPENPILQITHPKEYAKELVDQLGLFYTLGMPEDTKAVTDEKLPVSAFVQQIKHIEEEREKMFFYEFNRFDEGVLAFVFDAGDRLKHILWQNKSLEKGQIPKEIEEYYIEKDQFLGKVLSKIDDNTKLIILSDHGFNDFEREVNINTWLTKEGYMKIKESSGSLFEFVDWENTRAYSVGFTSIYLNLKGRESKGVVDESEKDQVINEIITKLKQLDDSGNNVFTNIYKGKEIYKGEYAHLAPDIVVGFAPGYRMSWKNAMGEHGSEIISDNTGKWQGDHLIDRSHVPGVLFTNFKINKPNPSILDIAPTVLQVFNMEIPETMDGGVLA